MRLLFACIFVDLLGFGIIIPLLPFMALQLGADAYVCKPFSPMDLLRQVRELIERGRE